MSIASYPEYHIALNKFTAANSARNYDDAQMHRRLRRYWHICAVLNNRMGDFKTDTAETDVSLLHFFHQQSL